MSKWLSVLSGALLLLPLSASATITAPLSQGSTGPVVTELQTLLKRQGYYTSAITGKYGGFTIDAVKAYQGVNRLPITGTVNTATAKALNTAAASTTLRRPTLSFTVIPNPVVSGKPVTMQWKSAYASSCTGPNNLKGLSGSLKSQPIYSSTPLTITCTGKGGIARSRVLAQTVGSAQAPQIAQAPRTPSKSTPSPKPAAPAPAPKPTGPTLTFTADGVTNLSTNIGKTVTFAWSSTGATACSTTPSSPEITGTSGTYTTAPLGFSLVYNMTCVAADGQETTALVRVSVYPADTPLPPNQPPQTPPPASNPPTLTLSASPNPVPSGYPTTLTWGSTNATSCSSSFSSQTSGTFMTAALTAPQTYTMTCTGEKGSVTKSVSITITSAQTPIPGVCGPANGQSFSSAPSANLCSAGSPSSVTGSGPWAWSCSGSNGGPAASCTATKASASIGADINTPGAIGSFTLTQKNPGVESANTPISLAFLNDHVAGSRGQIVSSGGHLYVGGQRIRLYGIDFSSGATLPMKADAPLIAARLKKEGFNAIRLAGFDQPVDPNPNPGTPPHASYRQQGVLNADNTTFNATALDYFDNFVYQLEQNGIYIDLLIHLDHTPPGYEDCLNDCRGIDAYIPAMVASQKDFANRFLNHVNPYTGRAYKNDPGVVTVEYFNENSVALIWGQGTLDSYQNSPSLYTKYALPLETKWQGWLQSKYATSSALNSAWGVSGLSFGTTKIPFVSNITSMSKQQYMDWIEFIASVEKAFKDDMKSYLRGTVGVTALIYSAQNNYDRIWTRSSDDASDVHQYFGDLGVATGQTNPSNGRPVWQVQNKSVLVTAASDVDAWRAGIVGPYDIKEYGKPAFITETAYRSGNQYLAEFEPILTAYAGFNDLDAVYIFSYKDNNLFNYVAQNAPWFNSVPNSLTRVASALAFRRGDITPGAPTLLQQTVDANLHAMVDFTTDKSRWVTSPGNFHFGGDVRAFLTNNVYNQVVSSETQSQVASGGSRDGNGAYVTTTGELSFKVGDRFTANASRTKTAVGFFRNESVSLGGGVDVYVGNTMNNYAVLNLTSLTSSDIPSSSKLLYTIAGYYTVPGEWSRTPGQNTYSWGTDTPRVEAVPSKVHISTSNTYKVTALDATGAPKKDVPVVKGSGYIEFVTGPLYDTPWYLIEQIPASPAAVAVAPLVAGTPVLWWYYLAGGSLFLAALSYVLYRAYKRRYRRLYTHDFEVPTDTPHEPSI